MKLSRMLLATLDIHATVRTPLPKDKEEEEEEEEASSSEAAASSLNNSASIALM